MAFGLTLYLQMDINLVLTKISSAVGAISKIINYSIRVKTFLLMTSILPFDLSRPKRKYQHLTTFGCSWGIPPQIDRGLTQTHLRF